MMKLEINYVHLLLTVFVSEIRQKSITSLDQMYIRTQKNEKKHLLHCLKLFCRIDSKNKKDKIVFCNILFI